MSSVKSTAADLDLAPAVLADLCPRVRPAAGPEPACTGRVLARARALVRAHVALDAADGRPLRHSTGRHARVLPLAAGAGTVVVTTAGVHVHLDDGGLAGHDLALDWIEVDDVGPAAAGGVRFLASRRLGALTIDVVGWLPRAADRGSSIGAG